MRRTLLFKFLGVLTVELGGVVAALSLSPPSFGQEDGGENDEDNTREAIYECTITGTTDDGAGVNKTLKVPLFYALSNPDKPVIDWIRVQKSAIDFAPMELLACSEALAADTPIERIEEDFAEDVAR